MPDPNTSELILAALINSNVNKLEGYDFAGPNNGNRHLARMYKNNNKEQNDTFSSSIFEYNPDHKKVENYFITYDSDKRDTRKKLEELIAEFSKITYKFTGSDMVPVAHNMHTLYIPNNFFAGVTIDDAIQFADFISEHTSLQKIILGNHYVVTDITARSIIREALFEFLQQPNKSLSYFDLSQIDEGKCEEKPFDLQTLKDDLFLIGKNFRIAKLKNMFFRFEDPMPQQKSTLVHNCS